MPFCPSCRNEFSQGTSRCAECNTELTDSLVDTTYNDELLDFYVCYNAMEADRVLDLLTIAGIEWLIRDRSSNAFPTCDPHAREQHIAVVQGQHSEAQHLLQNAIEDGVINSDGQFIQN